MDQRPRELPWITMALGAVCVGIFLLATYWGDGLYNTAIWRMGANSSEQVRNGQWWRLLASAFLHGNVMHIIVNMVALASFGPMLEQTLGAKRFLILYALSALVGALASALLRDNGTSVGASGAIWGLMTGAIGLAIWPRGLLPPGAIAAARQQLMIPLAINFFYSFQPGVDYLAHFGGGAAGLALMATRVITRGVAARNERMYGPFFGAPSQLEGDDEATRGKAAAREHVMTFIAVLFATAMVSSVALAIADGKPWTLRAAPTLARVAIGSTGYSLELPASIVEQTIKERDRDTEVATYATLQTSPLAVEVRHSAVSPAIAPDQLDEFIESIRGEIVASPPNDAVLQGEVTKLVINGQRAIRATYKLNEVGVHTWFYTNGISLIALRVYLVPDAPAAWAALPEYIGASVSVDVGVVGGRAGI